MKVFRVAVALSLAAVLASPGVAQASEDDVQAPEPSVQEVDADSARQPGNPVERAVVDLKSLPADGYFTTYPGARSAGPIPNGSVVLLADNESNIIWAGNCGYTQNVDNPHPSGSTTSVHGSWRRKSATGTCPEFANVDIVLEAWWCDSWAGCRWLAINSNSADVRAGGGAGRHVNARRSCVPYQRLVSYRGRVDVDLIGVSDPSGWTYSSVVERSCAPG